MALLIKRFRCISLILKACEISAFYFAYIVIYQWFGLFVFEGEKLFIAG